MPVVGRPTRASLHRNLILTIIYSVRNMEPIMSTEATLTSKGQTTIPKPIRDSLRMKTGDRMSFTLMPDGVVIMRVKNKRIGELAGLLHKKGRKPLPIELLSR
jgi:antitoxin PrlF